MIALIFILIGIFVVVYRSSRPGAALLSARRRVVLVSCLLSVSLFGFSYYKSVRPPLVNYYSTGWLWLIQSLNVYYGSVGNPNKIPDPGK